MPNFELQIIRNSSFKPAPWKNGGGITHEAIRVPPTGDPFRWRMSVAHIDSSGPFSEFALHNRKMVLLKGAGIEMRFGDGTKKTLRRAGDLIEFDGALATECQLLNGPCVDLNLMVAKSERAAVRVELEVDSLVIGASLDETTLVFPIDGHVELEFATRETSTLEPWDLAVLSHGSGRLRASATAVFLATIMRST